MDRQDSNDRGKDASGHHGTKPASNPSRSSLPSPSSSVSIEDGEPSAMGRAFASAAGSLLGFSRGFLLGVFDLVMVPIRFLSVTVVCGLFYGLYLLFMPLRATCRVPLLGLLSRLLVWLAELLLLNFLFRMTGPLRRFFTAGWRRGGAVPMLLGLLALVAGSAWQVPEGQVLIVRTLKVHHQTLPHAFFLYAGLLAAWVLGKACLYALPGRTRGRVRVVGPAALGRGESWTDTERLSTERVAELNDRFERAAAAGFAAMGYRVRVNGTQLAKSTIGHTGGGDGGVDVFAANRGESVVISCKRYADPVGVKEVREIFGTSGDSSFSAKIVADIVGGRVPGGDGPSKAALVTTVGVSAPAAEFAKRNGIRIFVISDKNRMTRV